LAFAWWVHAGFGTWLECANYTLWKSKLVGANFKNMRRVLRYWYSQLSNLSATINNLGKTAGVAANILETEKRYFKWAKLGDENTRFFHANATVIHNKNAIRVLKDENGQELFKHDDKATVLWESYKERLDTSEFNGMHYDLQDLIQLVDNLDQLVEPFKHEQIDNVRAQNWQVPIS
jgi:hypothetical protein